MAIHFTHCAVCVCYTDQPPAPSQANLATRSMPTASNTQVRPRQRVPTTPRTVTPQPRVPNSTPANSRAPGVAFRPRGAFGTRLTRPPTGIARPTVVQNISTPSQPPVHDTLPVPRRSMAPSRVAAIMMRRQYSSDRVTYCSSVILLRVHYC